MTAKQPLQDLEIIQTPQMGKTKSAERWPYSSIRAWNRLKAPWKAHVSVKTPCEVLFSTCRARPAWRSMNVRRTSSCVCCGRRQSCLRRPRHRRPRPPGAGRPSPAAASAGSGFPMRVRRQLPLPAYDRRPLSPSLPCEPCFARLAGLLQVHVNGAA